MDASAPIEIPKRALFKATEVCDLVKVQPYVLRTWEAEFPDLGVSKAAGGPRVYRRTDVEQVARIKHLLLVEGLTLRHYLSLSPQDLESDHGLSNAIAEHRKNLNAPPDVGDSTA